MAKVSEATPGRKSQRLEIRLSPQAKELIETACDVAGVSLSGFAGWVLVREAMSFLHRYETLTVSERDAAALVEAMEHPPAPTEALRKAWAEEFGDGPAGGGRAD